MKKLGLDKGSQEYFPLLYRKEIFLWDMVSVEVVILWLTNPKQLEVVFFCS